VKVWTPLLIPAILAGVLLLVSWRAWRRKSVHARGHWGGALAFAGAYLVAHVLLLSWPAMPPEQSAEWQAWIAVALAVIGVTQRGWGDRWYAAWPIRIAVSAALCYALLQRPIENIWGRNEIFAWLGGLTLFLTAVWFSTERIASFRGGASLPLSLWAWCALSAGTFTIAGSGVLGQLAGALAAACGAAVVLAWWAPGIRLSGGALTALVPLFFGLVLRSHFFGELTIWSAALLAGAPFALWFGEQRKFHFNRPWKSALVRTAAVAVPALIALGIEAWLKSADEPMY